VDGKYECHGLCTADDYKSLYPDVMDPNLAEGEKVNGALATHALVFQVTALGRGGKRLQRVVGVHAVKSCDADLLNQLFWKTIYKLKRLSNLTTVGSVCDGASVNRLMTKMNTGSGRGEANVFIEGQSHWCWNQVEPYLPLFFNSDAAHGVKKWVNNWEKSLTGDASETRRMRIPDPLVQAILSQVRPTAARAARAAGQAAPTPGSIGVLAQDSQGEEAYIYLGGRIYEHFTDMKPFMASSIEALNRDARVVELRFLLKVIRTWHTHNQEVNVGALVDKAERNKWGLSDQCLFDVQMQIDGFLALLQNQIERHGSVSLLGRVLSQDSLESLFGCIRQNCGGGNHPDVLKVVRAFRPVELQIESKRRTTKRRKDKANSGATDERPTKLSSWEAKRVTGKRSAVDAAIADLKEQAGVKKQKVKVKRWHMVEPQGMDWAWWNRMGATVSPRNVSWETMKRIQDWDQTSHFGTKLMHWLTPRHFRRSGFDRMNVGKARDVMQVMTAQQLRRLRECYS
jgi:hypothetical protein